MPWYPPHLCEAEQYGLDWKLLRYWMDQHVGQNCSILFNIVHTQWENPVQPCPWPTQRCTMVCNESHAAYNFTQCKPGLCNGTTNTNQATLCQVACSEFPDVTGDNVSASLPSCLQKLNSRNLLSYLGCTQSHTRCKNSFHLHTLLTYSRGSVKVICDLHLKWYNLPFITISGLFMQRTTLCCMPCLSLVSLSSLMKLRCEYYSLYLLFIITNTYLRRISRYNL